MVSVSVVDHSDQVLVSLGELCISDDYSDVAFVVEKDRIPAHRAILACRSEYFRALLYGGLEESKQNEITLNVSVIAFKQLLRYIYTGSIELKDVTLDNVLNLLALTHQYGITAFEKTISDYLYSIMSVENVCSILEEVRLLDMNDLIDKCFEFLDQNTHSVMKHESFSNLSYDTLVLVLDRDNLNAEEIEIFQAVQKWCKNNDAVGEKKKSLYEKVRYTVIPRNSLLTIVRPTGVLNPNQLLDIIFTQDGTGVHTYRSHSAPGKNMAANCKVEWITTADGLNQACFDLGKLCSLNYVYLTLGVATNSFGGSSRQESLSVSADRQAWSVVSTGTDSSGSYFARKPCISFQLQPVRYIRFQTPFYKPKSEISISAMLNPFQTAQKKESPSKR